MKKTVAVISFLFIFLASCTLALAQERKEPAAGEILFDVVLMRPLGIASIVIGSAVFLAGLPFTIPTRSVTLAGRKLVADPVRFTFARPVGEIHEDGRNAY